MAGWIRKPWIEDLLMNEEHSVWLTRPRRGQVIQILSSPTEENEFSSCVLVSDKKLYIKVFLSQSCVQGYLRHSGGETYVDLKGVNVNLMRYKILPVLQCNKDKSEFRLLADKLNSPGGCRSTQFGDVLTYASKYEPIEVKLRILWRKFNLEKSGIDPDTFSLEQHINYREICPADQKQLDLIAEWRADFVQEQQDSNSNSLQSSTDIQHKTSQSISGKSKADSQESKSGQVMGSSGSKQQLVLENEHKSAFTDIVCKAAEDLGNPALLCHEKNDQLGLNPPRNDLQLRHLDINNKNTLGDQEIYSEVNICEAAVKQHETEDHFTKNAANLTEEKREEKSFSRPNIVSKMKKQMDQLVKTVISAPDVDLHFVEQSQGFELSANAVSALELRNSAEETVCSKTLSHTEQMPCTVDNSLQLATVDPGQVSPHGHSHDSDHECEAMKTTESDYLSCSLRNSKKQDHPEISSEETAEPNWISCSEDSEEEDKERYEVLIHSSIGVVKNPIKPTKTMLCSQIKPKMVNPNIAKVLPPVHLEEKPCKLYNNYSSENSAELLDPDSFARTTSEAETPKKNSNKLPTKEGHTLNASYVLNDNKLNCSALEGNISSQKVCSVVDSQEKIQDIIESTAIELEPSSAIFEKEIPAPLEHASNVLTPDSSLSPEKSIKEDSNKTTENGACIHTEIPECAGQFENGQSELPMTPLPHEIETEYSEPVVSSSALVSKNPTLNSGNDEEKEGNFVIRTSGLTTKPQNYFVSSCKDQLTILEEHCRAEEYQDTTFCGSQNTPSDSQLVHCLVGSQMDSADTMSENVEAQDERNGPSADGENCGDVQSTPSMSQLPECPSSSKPLSKGFKTENSQTVICAVQTSQSVSALPKCMDNAQTIYCDSQYTPSVSQLAQCLLSSQSDVLNDQFHPEVNVEETEDKGGVSGNMSFSVSQDTPSDSQLVHCLVGSQIDSTDSLSQTVENKDKKNLAFSKVKSCEDTQSTPPTSQLAECNSSKPQTISNTAFCKVQTSQSQLDPVVKESEEIAEGGPGETESSDVFSDDSQSTHSVSLLRKNSASPYSEYIRTEEQAENTTEKQELEKEALADVSEARAVSSAFLPEQSDADSRESYNNTLSTNEMINNRNLTYETIAEKAVTDVTSTLANEFASNSLSRMKDAELQLATPKQSRKRKYDAEMSEKCTTDLTEAPAVKTLNSRKRPASFFTESCDKITNDRPHKKRPSESYSFRYSSFNSGSPYNVSTTKYTGYSTEKTCKKDNNLKTTKCDENLSSYRKDLGSSGSISSGDSEICSQSASRQRSITHKESDLPPQIPQRNGNGPDISFVKSGGSLYTRLASPCSQGPERFNQKTSEKRKQPREDWLSKDAANVMSSYWKRVKIPEKPIDWSIFTRFHPKSK